MRKARSHRSHHSREPRPVLLSQVPDDLLRERGAKHRRLLRWIFVVIGTLILLEAIALLRSRG